MLVHQSHYFSYCCFLPWIFIKVLALPLPLVGAAFALGWVSYCFAPILFQRLPPVKVFITGHLLVTVALCAICFCTHRLLPVLAAWFFSGFGGGSVYCLRDLNGRRGSLATDLDSWENLGHVSGAAIALIAATASNTPHCAFAVAAILALSTAILGRQAAQPPSTQEVSK